MNLICVSGKREAGKTTLAKAMEKYGYLRVSLASPLKEECKKLYNLSDEEVYGKHKETPTKYMRTDGSPLTPRDILIREGMLKRAIHKDYWCDKLADQLKALQVQTGRDMFIIDDIRFLNEIVYFKKFGAKFVRIERSEEAIGKAALDDLSETELDNYKDWDAHLLEQFNRTPEDLDKFAEYLITHLNEDSECAGC